MAKHCLKYDDGGRINLLELLLPEMESWFQEKLNEPKFRATQVWQWMWQKLACDFDSMSNISRSLRDKLKEKAIIARPEIAASQTGKDGVSKFLLRFADGAEVETVLIPSENREGEIRWAQCLSTQIGCPMRCAFCATGQMGFRRNMTMGEILSQVLVGKEYLNDRRPEWPILRNLVFMGMGEPLLNQDALLSALRSLHSDKGLNFSSRRITVSTCGIENGLARLGESGLAFLAVSLHAPTQALRESIMPNAAKWPLDKMLDALRKYPLKTRERITFEYLLLGGVNDGLEHARQLAKIMSVLKGKLNLIEYNPVGKLPFVKPNPRDVETFLGYLRSKNITAIIRKSKGEDIAAACGQLKTLRERTNS